MDVIRLAGVFLRSMVLAVCGAMLVAAILLACVGFEGRPGIAAGILVFSVAVVAISTRG